MRNRDLLAVGVTGMVISLAALIGLATLQYGMPDSYCSVISLGRDSIRHFRENLHLSPFSPMSVSRFIGLYREFLWAAWFGYAVVVLAGMRGAIPRPRYVFPLIIVLAGFLAVWWPASCSRDVYGYVAFGRMHALHGMNPYTHTPDALKAIGDPIGEYVRFKHPTIYGPTWTLLSTVMIWLMKSTSIWWQVVAMKLLAGASLVLTALVGRSIAERLSPGKGDLTLLAIGLNPLFLVEGPGNGHNDLLMMLPFLAGILLLLKKRPILAGLALGASLGIKFVSAIIVPWLAWEYTRGMSAARRIGIFAASALIVLIPSLLCYLPYWAGGRIFNGVSHRWHWGTNWSASEKKTTLTYWVTQGLSDASMHRVAEFLTGPIPVLIVFSLLTLWILRRGKDGSAMVAWMIMAGCLALLTMGVPFPWYFTWGWTVALVRWNRTHVALSAAYFVAGFIYTFAYTIPR